MEISILFFLTLPLLSSSAYVKSITLPHAITILIHDIHVTNCQWRIWCQVPVQTTVAPCFKLCRCSSYSSYSFGFHIFSPILDIFAKTSKKKRRCNGLVATFTMDRSTGPHWERRQKRGQEVLITSPAITGPRLIVSFHKMTKFANFTPLFWETSKRFSEYSPFFVTHFLLKVLQ